MFPRSSVGAWADIRAGGQIGATVQFYLFWRVNWSRVCGRGLSGNNSNQKITKLQARIRIWRGLCGYNSNLVIKRRAGAVFPPLLSAGVIMPRGGAILSILAWRLGGVGRHGLSGNNSNQKISKLQACGDCWGTFQKITKLQARIRIWRGLCGYNSNLVIKRRAGAVFPPLLSAGVIMPRGGTILK